MSIRKNGTRYMADFMIQGVRYRRQWHTVEEATAWEAELKKRIRLGMPYTELLEGTGDSITLGELADKTMVRYWEGTANEAAQRSNISLLLKHYGEGPHVETLRGRLRCFPLRCICAGYIRVRNGEDRTSKCYDKPPHEFLVQDTDLRGRPWVSLQSP